MRTNAMTLCDAINNRYDADCMLATDGPELGDGCMTAENAMLLCAELDDRNYVYFRNAIYRIADDGHVSEPPVVASFSVPRSGCEVSPGWKRHGGIY